MRCLSQDSFLEKLHPGVLMKLADCLDADSAWRQLISVMPYDCSSGLIEVIERDQYRLNLSAGKILLQRLYSKLVRISEMVEWLEEAGLLKPLLLLKADEPLRIIQEPQRFLKVCEGYPIRLTCLATSFPPPEYQWFKDNEELLLQQEKELVIDCAGPEHSGIYFCRIRAFHSERPSQCGTCSSHVTVIPQFKDASSRRKKTPLAEIKKLSINCEDSGVSSMVENSILHHKEKCDIKITEEPVSPGRVSQGCYVILKVRATSAYELSYQWHCNGREMEGETKEDLVLEHVFADPDTKELKKKYQCMVSNVNGHVFSECVSLELLPADESTQFEAEEKIALLIANEYYGSSDPLVLPSNDVETVAKLLKSIGGFKIISLKNLNFGEMKNAIRKFCETLSHGRYGFVYVAGHGLQLGKQTYLMPTDCIADFKGISPEQVSQVTICTDCILDQMQARDPALIVQVFDVCRTSPKGAETLIPSKCCEAKVKGNTFRCYSTASFCPALDRDGEKNGYFVKHLSKYLRCKERKTIEEVFKKVQVEFRHDVNVDESQCPTMESSLNEFRTLGDKVRESAGESVFDRDFSWTDSEADIFRALVFDIYCSSNSENPAIILKFYHHRKIFLNSMDVFVFLDVPECADLDEMKKLDVSVEFGGLKTAINKKNYTCAHDDVFLMSVIEVHDLQRVEGLITGKIKVENRVSGAVLLEEEFVLEKHPISQMRLMNS